MLQMVAEIIICMITSVVIIVTLVNSPKIVNAAIESRRNMTVSVTVLTITLVFIATNGVAIIFTCMEKEDNAAILFTLNSFLNPLLLFRKKIFPCCGL